jgi:glycosyltransferase involved in cell wall biosynthesis
MRILLHGNPPDAHSGYGVQLGLLGPRLAALGHDIAYSANTRVNLPATEWRGYPVYSAGIMEYGLDSLREHYDLWRADLLILLCDVWEFDPGMVAGMNVATWLPVDCDPLAAGDRVFLEMSGARPVAMSRHGQRMLEAAGKLATYVPHGLDVDIFKPGDRAAARVALGLKDSTFAVGINAQNVERKALVQTLAGFAAFHRTHPDSRLIMHTTTVPWPAGGGGPGNAPYLPSVIGSLGLTSDSVAIESHYDIVTCRIPAARMASWYNALDVLLAASMGEGFGVPVIEALACGTPVIGTRCSTMPELIPQSVGWLVQGIDVWKDRHQAWWTLPDPRQISSALGKALASAQHGGARRKACAEWGAQFDADRIVADCWAPLLKEIEAGL